MVKKGDLLGAHILLTERMGFEVKTEQDKDENVVRHSTRLFLDEEKNWPPGSPSLSMETWNLRMRDITPKPIQIGAPPKYELVKYQLVLTGDLQSDGSYRGNVVGKVAYGNDVVSFKNAEFELKLNSR